MDPGCCEAHAVVASLWLVFIGGLLGSAHCLGMCGPLVALAETMRRERWTPWAPLVLHAGRLLTYGALGAAAGLAGWAIERGGLAVGVQDVAALLGGATMVLFGLVLLDWLPLRWGRGVGERAAQHIASALASRRSLSGLVIGFYWGLLPCGLVWAMLPGAAAAGTALGGATFMLAFGAGTVPALLVLGGVASLVGARYRGLLSRLGATTVLVLGVLLVLRGAAGAGWIAHLKIAPGVPLF
jgi:hypothetical protein